MRITISRRRPKPASVPWWVWIGIMTRHGFVRSRNSALWNAWITTISCPIALIVSCFATGTVQRFALVGGLVAIPIAVHQWLAIRWLDRRKAWDLTCEPRQFRVRKSRASRRRGGRR